ncbi:UMTA methyltransferase family protein [Thermoascus aurantiacus ATCC 26904]
MAQEDASADADSAYNESIGTASYESSITSSIRNYNAFKNGRRYHAYHEGSYVLPNDDEEQDRMDLLNHIYRLVLGGNLHLSPIGPNPQRVLDIGTGTGIWAIQFAEEYPSAQVIGTDLSPVDDYEQEWLYKNKFDFIHGRELNGFVADYDRLFSQAFKHLKSGGYFEMQSTEAEILRNEETDKEPRYTHILQKCMHEWKEKMEKAGFVDVKDVQYKLPNGRWPKDPKLKEIGMYHQVQQIQAVDAYAFALLSRILGWSQPEIQVLCAHVRNELKDPSMHLYNIVRFVYGRKP